MAKKRPGLISYFVDGWRWTVRNPVVIALILILVTFNYAASSSELKSINSFRLTGESILSLIIGLLHQLARPAPFLIAAAGTLAAAAVTIFELGALMALFQNQARPFVAGIRAAFSLATIKFCLAYGVVFGLYGLFGLGVTLLVVSVGGQPGFGGGLILLIVIALTYPILYMLLSVFALLFIPGLRLLEIVRGLRLVFEPRNFATLVAFYVIRIGAELGILLPAAALANHLGLPILISGALVILAVSIPFALIRTTGFILKLDVLEPLEWFAGAFGAHYRQRRG